MLKNEMSHPTKKLYFRSALVQDTWQNNVVISIGTDGRITAIEDANNAESDACRFVALPGMTNVHSHAFQRGFAGLSEYRTGSQDSFWTWRKLMYDFVERMTPEKVFVIARHLYLEMLTAGYSWVGEFHYLHRMVGGASANDMTDAIYTAAGDAGIGLCHLPTLYQRGGFANERLSGGQCQFELNSESFIELVERCHSKWASNPIAKVGIALHSLRAVEAKAGGDVIDQLTKSVGYIPIHTHVAEQTKEVDDCLTTHGIRPVQFLMDRFDVDQRWCLIHATHLNDEEVRRIAASNAVVGLCPTTEANLGDGLFRATDYVQQDGRLAIGSDSHCSVDLREELRTLEYGQRLQTQSRAVLGTAQRSVGRNLYAAAAAGGAQAIGIEAGSIKVGLRADLTLIDPDHRAIAGATGDRLLDRLVFTNAGNPVAGVVLGGELTETKTESFQATLANSSREFAEAIQ